MAIISVPERFRRDGRKLDSFRHSEVKNLGELIIQPLDVLKHSFAAMPQPKRRSAFSVDGSECPCATAVCVVNRMERHRRRCNCR